MVPPSHGLAHLHFHPRSTRHPHTHHTTPACQKTRDVVMLLLDRLTAMRYPPTHIRESTPSTGGQQQITNHPVGRLIRTQAMHSTVVVICWRPPGASESLHVPVKPTADTSSLMASISIDISPHAAKSLTPLSPCH